MSVQCALEPQFAAGVRRFEFALYALSLALNNQSDGSGATAPSAPTALRRQSVARAGQPLVRELNISNATCGDSGAVICLASNDAGYALKSVNLTVLCALRFGSFQLLYT